MYKYLISLSLIAMLLLALSGCGQKEQQEPVDDQQEEITQAQDDKAKKFEGMDDYTKNPLVGKAVCLNMMVAGKEMKDFKMDHDKAKELVNEGQQIVIVSGGKTYFVYDKDGKPASGKLVDFLEVEGVQYFGHAKKGDGINIFIVDKIEKSEKI